MSKRIFKEVAEKCNQSKRQSFSNNNHPSVMTVEKVLSSVQATDPNWGQLTNLKFNVHNVQSWWLFTFVSNSFLCQISFSMSICLFLPQKATIASLNTKHVYKLSKLESPEAYQETYLKRAFTLTCGVLLSAHNVKAWFSESWVKAANEQRNQNSS